MMVLYFSLRVPVGKSPLLSRHFPLLNRDFLEIFNTFCASWHLFHTCAGARVIGGSDLSEVYARRVRCVRTSAASVPIVLLRPPPARDRRFSGWSSAVRLRDRRRPAQRRIGTCSFGYSVGQGVGEQ